MPEGIRGIHFLAAAGGTRLLAGRGMSAEGSRRENDSDLGRGIPAEWSRSGHESDFGGRASAVYL